MGISLHARSLRVFAGPALGVGLLVGVSQLLGSGRSAELSDCAQHDNVAGVGWHSVCAAEAGPRPTRVRGTPSPAPAGTPPAATATGVAQLGEPYPSAPLCPSHDPLAYHGLWDGLLGCHHDHSHGADVAAVDHIFGPLPAYIPGVSGPHATTNENELKHEGYKWIVFERPDCGFERADSQRDSCILAGRIMHHAHASPHDPVVRLHSVFAQLLICDEDDLTVCGTVTTSGWDDFGCLVVPYKGKFVPLPGDPAGGCVSVHVPGYRGHAPALTCPNGSGDCNYTWLSAPTYGYNKIFEKLGFRSFDDWMGTNPGNPHEMNFVCPTGSDGLPVPEGCEFNHSSFQLFAIWLRVPASLDPDGDGLVTFSGWTDRRGQIVQGCKIVSLDCLPLVMVHVPRGLAQYSERVAPKSSDPRVIEHDIYFCGNSVCDRISLGAEPSGWITYPN